MVKNPPSNAGDVGSIPVQGTTIPHAAGQLSLHTTTREKPARRNEDPVQPKLKKEDRESPNILPNTGSILCLGTATFLLVNSIRSPSKPYQKILLHFLS